MKKGKTLWAWPHCVQQENITQVAIDKKLTLIALEETHEWSIDGDWVRHNFNKNNEIAGYAGIHHALNLLGRDGYFGPRHSAVVISYGSVSQGAGEELRIRGVEDITILIPLNYHIKLDNEKSFNAYSFFKDDKGRLKISVEDDLYTFDILKKADIIVNGSLQDSDSPYMFVRENEVGQLKEGCLIVDISCDEGMGFPFTKPTTFKNPMFSVGSVQYYAVDHTLSYLWNAVSWEISKSLVSYLPTGMNGTDEWNR